MYFGVHTPGCDGSKCAPRYIRCPDNLLHSVSEKLRQEMEATTTDELNDGQDLNLDTTVLSPHPPRHARRSPDADDCGEKRQMVGGKRPMMGGRIPRLMFVRVSLKHIRVAWFANGLHQTKQVNLRRACLDK